MEIQKIEQYLNNGDPYTFLLLAVNSEGLVSGKTDCKKAEEMMMFLGQLLRKKFGSGMLITPFEGDLFLAFAPFVLSKSYLMGILDSVQQEYYDFIRGKYPDSCISVSAGGIIGVKQSNLEELCDKAERLIEILRKQGMCGYKIIEN